MNMFWNWMVIMVSRLCEYTIKNHWVIHFKIIKKNHQSSLLKNMDSSPLPYRSHNQKVRGGYWIIYIFKKWRGNFNCQLSLFQKNCCNDLFLRALTGLYSFFVIRITHFLIYVLCAVSLKQCTRQPPREVEVGSTLDAEDDSKCLLNFNSHSTKPKYTHVLLDDGDTFWEMCH